MSSLYLSHFKLNKEPFKITPDLDFFFAGGQRGDILTALLHVARHDEGIVTLVAEVGSGKTLLARLMISRLDWQISSVYLANPCFSRHEILGAIGRDLGLNNLPESGEMRLAALQQELLARHAQGQRVLLVIDEAHAMPAESLEEVRLLSNLETGHHKLINIMLFGQPELDEVLADPRLRQVRDRIVHRFKLDPLSAQDVSAYVDHRLRAAGWQGSALFSPTAMAQLAKASGGRARRINILAGKALLSAYAKGLDHVANAQVNDALGELPDDITPKRWRLNAPWLKWAGVAIALLLAGGVALLGGFESTAPKPQPVQAVQPVQPVNSDAAVPTASLPTAVVTKPVIAPPASKPPHIQAAAITNPTPASATFAEGTALQASLARTQSRLANENLGGYTLQLAAIPRSDVVANNYLRLVLQHQNPETVFAHLSHYRNKDYVAVFVGDYPTAALAQQAMDQLPEALKANRPILRTWVKIKQEKPS